MSTKQVGSLFPYLLMVLILIFRPQGILGKRET
jgi:branched-subunit amino acid ABC-type transport system permease component